MHSSNSVTQVTKTAEGEAKWCADYNIPISYSHALILQLPRAMQDTVWNINEFLHKHSSEILYTGFAVGTAVYLFSAVPFTTVLGGAALGIFALSTMGSYAVKLNRDDKAWILVAAMLASLALTWPISLSVSVALVWPKLGPQHASYPSKAFLDKYQSQQVKKARTEDDLQGKMRTYIRCEGHRSKALAELQDILQTNKVKLEEDFNVSDYNEFAVALEAYVRNAADSHCQKTPQEVRDFLQEMIPFWSDIKNNLKADDVVYNPVLAAVCIIEDNRVLMRHSSSLIEQRSSITYSNKMDRLYLPTRQYIEGPRLQEPTPCSSFREIIERNEYQNTSTIFNNTTDRVLYGQENTEEPLIIEPGQTGYHIKSESLTITEYKILGKLQE